MLQQCKPYPESGPGFGYVGRDKRTVLPIGACPLASEGINARLANTYLQPDERTRMEKHKRVTIREDATKRVYLSTGPTRKPRKVKERALDRELMLPLENFWQVNPTMFHRILVHIKELVIQRKPTTLLDLYCGSGAFALALADLVRHVCGVESHSAAVGAARACATRFALDHCTFIHGKTEDILDDVLTATPELQTSFAILDPPRAGCQPGTIDALRASPVATLAYVACDARQIGPGPESPLCRWRLHNRFSGTLRYVSTYRPFRIGCHSYRAPLRRLNGLSLCQSAKNATSGRPHKIRGGSGGCRVRAGGTAASGRTLSYAPSTAAQPGSKRAATLRAGAANGHLRRAGSHK